MPDRAKHSVYATAFVRMSGLALQMRPDADPVTLTDLRTSMADARIAFTLAAGRACDRDGWIVEEATMPVDAAESSTPYFTVLPSSHFGHHTALREDDP